MTSYTQEELTDTSYKKMITSTLIQIRRTEPHSYLSDKLLGYIESRLRDGELTVVLTDKEGGVVRVHSGSPSELYLWQKPEFTLHWNAFVDGNWGDSLPAEIFDGLLSLTLKVPGLKAEKLPSTFNTHFNSLMSTSVTAAGLKHVTDPEENDSS